MGASLTKEDFLKQLKSEGFSLPDIGIDSSLKRYSEQDVVIDNDTSSFSKRSAVVLKQMIEMRFVETGEKHELEEQVKDLSNSCQLLVDFCERYEDNEKKLIEVLLIFERRFIKHVERVKSALLGDCMSSQGLKIWINLAFCHIDMQCELGKHCVVSRATILSDAEEKYREDWTKLVAKYKLFKKSTVQVEKYKIVDHEHREIITFAEKIILTVDEVVDYMFDGNAQLSEIQNVFGNTFKKIALMEGYSPKKNQHYFPRRDQQPIPFPGNPRDFLQNLSHTSYGAAGPGCCVTFIHASPSSFYNGS